MTDKQPLPVFLGIISWSIHQVVDCVKGHHAATEPRMADGGTEMHGQWEGFFIEASPPSPNADLISASEVRRSKSSGVLKSRTS